MSRSRPILLSLLVLSSLILLPVQTAQAAGIPDPRFGVIEAYAAPEAATSLGAGWERITFRWNEIQPNGTHEWNAVPVTEAQIDAEIARGREIVGLLIGTPGWATDTSIGPGVPQGLYLPTDHPSNLWAQYLRTIVNKYEGRINHWIVWNEPDIPDTQHMSWGGSTEDFVQLLKVAYQVAKAENPNAVIHLPAVTHWWDETWFGTFLDTLLADPSAVHNNYYFDVATLHIYFRSETVYSLISHYYGQMRDRGLNKPIWVVETNAPPSDDPAWPVPNAQFDISQEQQAAFIVQAFSLAIAAGAQRVAVYKMADTESDRAANPEPFGLVRMDGSRRPAFAAYQAASTYLAGFRSARWDRRDTLSLVTVDRGEQTTTVVWSRTPQPQTAMVAARTTRALLVNALGQAYTVYPERGYYYIPLPGAECSDECLIGGLPYMLVEDAPTNANTAPQPSSPTPSPTNPTPTPTSTPTLTPTPTATPTPTSTATSTPTSAPTPTATSTATAISTATPEPPSTPTPIPESPSYGTPFTDPVLLIVLLGFVAGAILLIWRRLRGRQPE